MSDGNYECPVCSATLTLDTEACAECGMPQRAYREAIGLPERHLQRGMRLMQRKAYDEALEHFYAARRLQPARTEGLKRTVSCLMHMGRFEYALQILMAEHPDEDNLALRAACIRAMDQQQRNSDAQNSSAEPSLGVVEPSEQQVAPDKPLPQQQRTGSARKRKRDTRSRRREKQANRKSGQ